MRRLFAETTSVSTAPWHDRQTSSGTAAEARPPPAPIFSTIPKISPDAYANRDGMPGLTWHRTQSIFA